MTDLTVAGLAQQLSNTVDNWDTFVTNVRDFAGTPPNGGPFANGYVYVSNGVGVQTLVPSIPTITSLVTGPVANAQAAAATISNSIGAAQTAANSANSASSTASGFSSQASANATLSLTYAGWSQANATTALTYSNNSQGWSNTASGYANTASTYRTYAQSNATAAASSASAASNSASLSLTYSGWSSANATTALTYVGQAQSNATAAANSAAAAANSAAQAAAIAGGQFVDLTSAQTVGGAKTFNTVVTATSGIVSNTTIDAFTPNNGTTSALRIRANSTTGYGYLQATDAAAASQWGLMTFSNGVTNFTTNSLQWNGTKLFQDGDATKSDRQVVVTPTISSGVLTLDLSQGSVFDVAWNANITSIAVTNAPTGMASWTLILNGQGTAYTVSWATGTFKFPGGTAPTLTYTANTSNFLTMATRNQGTRVDVFFAGATA